MNNPAFVPQARAPPICAWNPGYAGKLEALGSAGEPSSAAAYELDDAGPAP